MSLPGLNDIMGKIWKNLIKRANEQGLMGYCISIISVKHNFLELSWKGAAIETSSNILA